MDIFLCEFYFKRYEAKHKKIVIMLHELGYATRRGIMEFCDSESLDPRFIQRIIKEHIEGPSHAPIHFFLARPKVYTNRDKNRLIMYAPIPTLVNPIFDCIS